MFEDFTFDQRVNPGTAPDPDTRLSPTDVPADWSSSQRLAAPTQSSSTPYQRTQRTQRNSETIDTLAHQLSRQSLLSRTQHEGLESISVPVEDASSQRSPVASSSVPSQAPLAQQPSETLQNSPPRNLDRAQSQLPDSRTDLVASCASGPQPRIDTRCQTNPSNPRAVREALMEIMIAHGVQCNVQNSSPPTPVSNSQPGFPSGSSTDPIEPADQSMLDALEPLEVDMDFREQEEEALIRNLVTLRQAGMAGGIRKPNGLKFCTSTEAALKCKNLKRNKLKMRKRDRSKPMLTPPPEAPVGSVSI
ncbi:uncharacterized protein JN550_010833 [Neoarthrinium moseri]|uniref:uncharacterized protein n=1 Tax=Neoarthrinium moseri TaxID=1658444 RepID=UPI001FDDE607|nr:uncharacterized protein JN550_010833 [Neoarthrinium moseri]KAI1861453.1 hypothetical protein JN550_010833 [Neoarthrinium moseri]